MASRSTASTTLGSTSSLLQQAELAAQRVIRQWIRKTLREAFLQALQQRLVSSSSSVMQMSQQDLDDCVQAVEQVSQAWQHQLEQANHDLVARWVQDVFEKGTEYLWQEEEEDVDDNNQKSPIMEETPQTHNVTTTPTATATTVEAEDDSKTSTEIEQEKSSSSLASSLVIPYAALRKMAGTKDSMVSIKEKIVQLKEMAHRGESYWPAEHSNIMEQAYQDLPKRLKREAPTANALSSSSLSSSFQVIPKSLWEQKKKRQDATVNGNISSSNAQPPQPDSLMSTGNEHDDDETKLLSAVLARKRKNYVRHSVTSQQKRHRSSSTTAARDDNLHVQSRPPSDLSSCRFDANEDLTMLEKHQLDTLLHPEDDDNADSPSPMVLFGALSTVGDVHYNQLQQQGMLPPRKHSGTQYRAAIQERLNPQRVLKNCNPQTYRSKVLKTEDKQDNHNGQYFDLDLGWSLMEIQRQGGTKSEKHLLCFSSMEIKLRDEDGNENNSDVETELGFI